MGTVVRCSDFQLDRVLEKCRSRERLGRREIRCLLDLREDRDLAQLFRAAREMRHRYFGEAVFLYGFVYFSTWCRNDCIFCLYRRSNSVAKRYRKPEKEVIEIAVRLAESGVHLVDLTMGEDPFFHQDDGARRERLVDLVKGVKVNVNLPLMVSPGVVPRDLLLALREAGADWYACYQETHNRRLFERLRPGQDYDGRLATKIAATELGLLIEEGILAGVGESADDMVTSAEVMRTLGAQQVRVMTFVPQKGTPLEKQSPPPSRRELSVLAVLRLLFPDRLIPASLDVRGITGLRDRLRAGANVITSLIPPRTGLVGVSQSGLDIEEGYRTVRGILPVLEKMGLRMAALSEYLHWIDAAHEQAAEQQQRTEKTS